MINKENREFKPKRLAHIKDKFSKFIGAKSGTRMVIKSCRDWSRTLISEDLVGEIVLAHSLKVKAIASAKIKTDAVDSRILAQLLMADHILQAHLRKSDNRIKQRTIRHRAFMVVMRTRWLLKIVYHILKERRPYVTAYGKMVEAGAAFYFT